MLSRSAGAGSRPYYSSCLPAHSWASPFSPPAAPPAGAGAPLARAVQPGPCLGPPDAHDAQGADGNGLIGFSVLIMGAWRVFPGCHIGPAHTHCARRASGSFARRLYHLDCTQVPGTSLTRLPPRVRYTTTMYLENSSAPQLCRRFIVWHSQPAFLYWVQCGSLRAQDSATPAAVPSRSASRGCWPSHTPSRSL